MVFTQGRGFVVGASVGLQIRSLRCRVLACRAADTASLATRFLFVKLTGVAITFGFGEKRCRKNLPLCGRTDSLMTDLVPNLQSLVDSDRFLATVNLDAVNDMLDSRDAAPFDSEWVRVHELVTQHELGPSPAVDALRESAFKRAFAITESPDVCGYISDDFGLIADAARADVSDAWLAALAASYASGVIPHGELVGDSRPLVEIVSEFQP